MNGDWVNVTLNSIIKLDVVSVLEQKATTHKNSKLTNKLQFFVIFQTSEIMIAFYR